MRNRLVLAAALMVSSAAAVAESPTGVAFGGASIGDGVSGYAGLISTLQPGQLGRGLAIRASANAGTYHYVADGREIDGRYTGGEVALVYQLSGQWGWANISAGPRVTDTSLSPPDPTNKRAGTRWDFGFQADGAFNFDPSWRLTYLGSVGIRDGAYLLKADVGPFVDQRSQTRVGIEGALQGDPKYDAQSAGVYVSTQISKAATAQVSGGIRNQSGRDTGAYVAIGTSVLF